MAVPYTIRRSQRARRATIHVSAEGVEVVVPARLGLDAVAPFVERKRPWIERTLLRLREAEAAHPVPDLRDGGWTRCLDERLTLRVRTEPGRRRSHVARRGGELAVVLSPGDSLERALERWYRRRARTEVAPRLDAAAARAGVSYAGLTIRGQRTRWASCSAQGAMSFNWRLLLAPAHILDYVVEHEVCHLAVPDHSERFWALLERRRPGYRDDERWLRRHGHVLALIPSGSS